MVYEMRCLDDNRHVTLLNGHFNQVVRKTIDGQIAF